MDARRVLAGIRMAVVWIVVLAGAFMLAGGMSIGRATAPAEITDVATLTGAGVATNEAVEESAESVEPATTTTTLLIEEQEADSGPGRTSGTTASSTPLDAPEEARVVSCFDGATALTGGC